MALDVRSIRIAGYLDAEETLSAFVAVDSFGSRNIPHEFLFSGITIDLLQHPLLHVDAVTLNRIGMPLYSPDNPPPATYTEEQNLAGDWLDLALVMRNVRVEVAPQMDLGPLLDPIVDGIMGVLNGVWSLPSINRLSRELGGPGYLGVLLPPPPGLTVRVEGLQLEVVDEPMESFLQHLHLLWLDERNEQERRRALLQLETGTTPHGAVGGSGCSRYSQDRGQLRRRHAGRLGRGRGQPSSGAGGVQQQDVRQEGGGAEADDERGREPEESQPAALLRRQAQCGRDHGRRARLVHGRGSCGAAHTAIRAGRGDSVGRRGSADGRQEQSGHSIPSAGQTRRECHLHSSPAADTIAASPSSSIASTASPTASPFNLSPSSSSGRSGRSFSPVPGTLGGRYIKVQVDVVQLRLRNFPLPLFSCSQVTVGGHTVMAEMDDPHSADGSSLFPMMAPAPAAGSRTVKLSQCSRPAHVFYDVTVGISAATVAFSPHFAYTLNDVMTSMQRVAPPLPPPMFAVAPPIPARPADGSEVNVIAQPINLVHFARSFLHGRLSLSVTNIALHLLSSPSPYETGRFLQVHVQSVAVSTDGPLIGVKVEDVDVIPVPHKEGQPSLLEMPAMECWLTLNWQCKDAASKRIDEDEYDTEHRLKSVDSSDGQHRGLGSPYGENTFVVLTTDSIRSVGLEKDVRGRTSCWMTRVALELHTQRPPALTHIASNKVASPSPSISLGSSSSSIPQVLASPSDQATAQLLQPPSQQQRHDPSHKRDTPLSLVVADGVDHSCHLHLSLSLSFAPTTATAAPLDLTLHASSLAVLFHLGALYSRIPPLPLPNRKRLAQYYFRYHAARVNQYAQSVMREVDVRGARLVLLDNNINDDMIGMIQRGELDGNIFRRLLEAIAHSEGRHARTDHLYSAFIAHRVITNGVGTQRHCCSCHRASISSPRSRAERRVHRVSHHLSAGGDSLGGRGSRASQWAAPIDRPRRCRGRAAGGGGYGCCAH